MKSKISSKLKLLTVFLVVSGISLNFINAKAEGYSHFSKRLMYFTTQSNIWIASVFVLILVSPYVKKWKNNKKLIDVLHILRYVFTVSITLTGFVFCAILAPGAKNDSYNAWTLGSLFVHVFVPVISIADFLIDDYIITIHKKHIMLTAIPPLLYVLMSSILFFLNVDFGRGDPFPYFFLNYSSPAGFFGTSDEMPYIVGSFYWLIFLLLLIIGMGAFYRAIYKLTHKK